MIYVASMMFETSSEDGSNDTEGHFVVVGEGSSADDMLTRIIPAKLREIEQASDLDYSEFYLTGLVELKYPLERAVVLGFVEGTRRDAPQTESWEAVALESDRQAARACETDKISSTVPFATIGKPPLRLTR